MTVLVQAAVDWARRQGSPGALRAVVKDRLLCAAPVPVGYGRLDEFAEDVLVTLLTIPFVDELSQKAIASGWDAALCEVLRLLRDPLLSEEETSSLQKPFGRVFRVAELSGHALLRDGVRSTLPLVLNDDTRATPRQVQSVVAAAMA